MSRAIRATAWAFVAAGVAAPVLRRRLELPTRAAFGAAAIAPAALCVAARRTVARDLAVCALNMWGYVFAYEMPNDDPERLAARVHVGYPIAIDRVLGLGTPPTLRLQRRFSAPGRVNRFERVLVWCHWVWFLVPHGSVAYVRWRRPDRFPSAAARMYAVFDLGAVFYSAVPTAPPWWAAQHGLLEHSAEATAETGARARRMMIEYGEEFWGERWDALYGVLGGNPLAAMPSLHFATSVAAARLMSEVGPVSGTIGWAYALTLGLALVYLGEHYAIDLIAGLALTESVRAAAPRAAPIARGLSSVLGALEAKAA
jgi:membrane-associated phospholipid phosphatase